GGIIYGQVYVAGVTPNGAAPIAAELGYGNEIEDPMTWTWGAATYNPTCSSCGNNNEYYAPLRAPPGAWAYAYRYSRSGGPYCYGDLDGAGKTMPFNGNAGANLGSAMVAP